MADLLAYVPKPLRPYAKDYFAYSVQSLNLAAGGTATPNFAVDSDADFMIVALAGTARNPANDGVVFATPALTVDLRATGSGRNQYDQPQDWNNVCGTAQRPGLLVWPKFVKRASQMDVALVNFDPAQAYDVRITFHGFKVFEFLEDTVEGIRRG